MQRGRSPWSCVFKLAAMTFLGQAGGQDGVGMLPSVLWQRGLPCPWIENAVMTSWASTPAGNYRTNHVKPPGHARACALVHTCRMETHRQPAPSQYLSISPMQSSRCGPMHLQQIQSGNRERKRDSCYRHTQPAGIPFAFFIPALLSLGEAYVTQNYSLWQEQQ